MVNKQKTWPLFNERCFEFQMNEIQRSKIILRILNKIYPKTPIPLKHRNKFTLLVTVL